MSIKLIGNVLLPLVTGFAPEIDGKLQPLALPALYWLRSQERFRISRSVEHAQNS
jgi:hypothetical protein